MVSNMVKLWQKIAFLSTLVIGFYFFYNRIIPLLEQYKGETSSCDENNATTLHFNRSNSIRGTSPPPIFKILNEGEIYIKTSNFLHGGILDFGKGSTLIYIGDTHQMPIYHEQSSTVDNALFTLSIGEDSYGKVMLDPGEYWIWSSNIADITLFSCSTDAVMNPRSIL